jgi:hypothetical protein
MHKAIIDIVQYVQNNRNSSFTDELEIIVGKENLRDALINLLSWIKRRQTFKRHKQLTLSKGYEWEKNLRKIVNATNELNQLFMINQDELDYIKNLSEHDRKELQAYVASNFRPPLMT